MDVLHPEWASHLAGHLTEALAEDPRTNALDIQVTITANKVFLLGRVLCATRKSAAELVVRESLPQGMLVVNHLWVETYTEPPEPQKLP